MYYSSHTDPKPKTKSDLALIEMRHYLTEDVVTGVTTSEVSQHRSDVSQVLYKAGRWLDVPLVLNVGVFTALPGK